MTLFHRHRWAVVSEHALGHYEKQEGQDCAFYCVGRVENCRCGEMRLVPDDGKLQTVRVEQQKEKTMQAEQSEPVGKERSYECGVDDEKRIENVFRYHPPNADQSGRYINLRNKAKELAYLIQMNCPNSREKSLAFTTLEETIMWANASIVKNE